MESKERSIRTRVLLEGLQRNEPKAADELLQLVEQELYGMAQVMMNDQKIGHTLQATALVNEAWLRLAGAGISLESRAHFLAVAATAMRSVLVDHARRRLADKRGGGLRPASIDAAAGVGTEDDGSAMLSLHEALERLSQQDEQAAKVAELRLFAGMEHTEVARALSTSLRTIERRWHFARQWLQRELRPSDAPENE